MKPSGHAEVVITSYSIHYTKLYEAIVMRVSICCVIKCESYKRLPSPPKSLPNSKRNIRD